MQPAHSALPFDDIRALLEVLPEKDGAKADAARARNAQLTKPLGSLGRLEDLAEFLSGWQGRHPPRLDRPTVVVFAGNHGVVRHGVAAFPQEVTEQMVANFRSGGAAINQLCKTFGLGLKVFELALSVPTRDITEHAALEEAECVAAMAFGMEAIADGNDLLCLGEMGIGNTTIAAALCGGLFGGRGADGVGNVKGVEEAGVRG
jgi:nicotinate-nucleotide--dimethylbenzimidazole phosphoribosyltransferase